MFNVRILNDTDSLDSLNIVNQQRNSDDQDPSNNNNYEFLIDEEYQQLKHQKERCQNQKWTVIGEKLTLKFVLKEIIKDYEEINHQLYKQTQNQEKIVGNKHIFRHFDQRKSKDLRKMSIYDLIRELRVQQNQLFQVATNVIDGQIHLSHMYEKELDQIQYLEQQIKTRIETDPSQERYIEDLEQQLKETRGALLDKKLLLTDKDQEILGLKKQIHTLTANFSTLEEQKKEIDQLVIKVSQELKSKEYDMRDYNYQIHLEKEQLMKQSEVAKKELAEEKERRSNLEMIEGDILHKLSIKEHEVQDLRQYIGEIEDKLSVKTDAIEKAQKVIQMLNDEVDKTAVIITKLEQERDQFRLESKDQSRRVIDLNKQLQTQVVQQQQQQSQVSSQLKQEIDELKIALSQYQQEFEQEKRQLQESLRECNEQRYTLQLEKEKLDSTQKKQISSLQDQVLTLQGQNQANKEKSQILEKELKRKEDTYRQERQQYEEQAFNQIRYLQKRIKEISGENGRTSNIGNTSYLQVVKDEFEKALLEINDIKAYIKKSSSDSNISFTLKLDKFDEYKSKIIDQLEQWEIKVTELTTLSEKNQFEIEEQRRIFLQMKSMIKEKDNFIANLQKQQKSKDFYQQQQINVLQTEIQRQSEMVRHELINEVKENEKKMYELAKELCESDARFQSFKYEYTQILEDRDVLKQTNSRLLDKIDLLLKEQNVLKNDYLDIIDRVRVIIDAPLSSQRNLGELVSVLEQRIDELKVRRDEVINYKTQISNLSQQIDEEKNFMQGKIQTVEQQLEFIQRQGLNKEEELQIQYLQKETKHINEIQKLKTEISALQNQLQTRERQVKKLQEKADESLSKVQDIESLIDNLKQQNLQLTESNNLLNEKLSTQEKELDNISFQLKSKQEQLAYFDEDKKKIEEKLKIIRDSLYEKELDLQRERDLNLQIQDEKYKAVNMYEEEVEKRAVFERENQNLYKELQITKQNMLDLSNAFQEVEREKMSLQQSYNQMHNIVEDAQNEINQSQYAIESLNNALEKSKSKAQKIRDLKHQVKVLKSNERSLQETINDLRRIYNPVKISTEVQTNESGSLEIQYMREEIVINQKQQMIMQRECEQIREALRRQSVEIDRLIEEKRDLEDLVEQQNQSIKQIRYNQAFKENVNIVNQPFTNKTQIGDHSMEVYSKILQEKENYIMRLESELNEMRKEIEALREKLIQYEISNLSIDRTLTSTGQLSSQYYKNAQHKKSHPLRAANFSMNFNSSTNNYQNAGTYATLQILSDENMQTRSINKSFQH